MMEHLANLVEFGARNVAYDRPMLGRAALGGGMTMAGQSAPLLSLLDSPRRGIAGGLMRMMGRTAETPEGDVQHGSIYPMLAGLAAAGATALMPGGIALSPYVGALTTGLAQQVGEYFRPNEYASFSPGDVNRAIGIPSNILTDIANSLLTDPMTYAGLGSGYITNMRKAMPSASAAVPTNVAAVAEAPLAMNAVEAMDDVAAAAAASNAPVAKTLEQQVAERLGLPPHNPMMGPRPLTAQNAIDLSNQVSMAGYRPDLIDIPVDYLNPLAKPKMYKNYPDPQVAEALESLGVIGINRRAQPGAAPVTRYYDLPEGYAEVRGPKIMATKTPHPAHGIMNYSQTLLDQEGDELANQLLEALLAGRLSSTDPYATYLRMRQAVMNESAAMNAQRAAEVLGDAASQMSPVDLYRKLKSEAEGL